MPLCFQVQLNEEPPVRAGDDAISVLTAIVTYVAPGREEMELRVGGLLESDSSGKEHAEWLHRGVRVGDRIILTVTDSSEIDPPVRRTQEDPELDERRQRRYYEKLKAHYEGS